MTSYSVKQKRFGVLRQKSYNYACCCMQPD